jgi:hypothetical protein
VKQVIKGPEKPGQLPALLEGYLYGLGEVCHSLFGSQGEVAMYTAIGSFFLRYLKTKLGINFPATDPWEKYCEIVKAFTEYGFYGYVELEERGPNQYWMLETDQYAGNVWEEQGAWERGTPPCPLWSIILHGLAEIGYTIILDSVVYNKEVQGYESTFHFEELDKPIEDIIAETRDTLRGALTTICANCKKVRDEDGQWYPPEIYFERHSETTFSHGVCPICYETLYPDFGTKDGETSSAKGRGA